MYKKSVETFLKSRADCMTSGGESYEEAEEFLEDCMAVEVKP